MKKKLLLTSILSIVMCVSLIVGATFALFTSEDNVNISVTSGKVNLTAEIVEDSVATKQLYDADFIAGANNMFKGEGAAVFTTDYKNLTLAYLVPGDAIKFQIKVTNGSNVDVKYRTIVSTNNDGKLFEGLAVSVAGISTNYNGKTYTTNWDFMPAGEQLIDVVIELPEDAGNEYQATSCSINYYVEAVQGNASTTNESTKVEVTEDATQSVTLKTNGADSPVVEIPTELVQELANKGSIGLVHSEPKVEGNTVSFETMKLVDKDNNEIDLETMGNDVEIPVTLPAVSSLANKTVYVYHDGVAVATVVADANGVVSYTTTHFCEVAVSTTLLYDTAIVNDSNQFATVVGKAFGNFTVILNSDVEISKQVLITKKDLKLTIELNGYDINANVPTSEVFQVQSNNNALTLKSSIEGSQVNVGDKALVLAYGNVNVANIDVVVGSINSSSYQTFKMQKGDLTIKDSAISVKYLGTSLISGASSVAINGSNITVDEFKTNAGELIANTAATKILVKDSALNIVLNPTYKQYFVCGYAENVEIANSAFVVTDLAGASYNITKANGNYAFNKIGYVVNSFDQLSALCADVANGETIVFGSDITSVDGVLITDKNLTVDLNGYTFTVSNGANVSNRAFKITGSSVVTVKNGTIIAEGNISSGAYGSVRTEGSAKVTLDSLVLRNYRGGGLNVKVVTGTEVTINNCEIYAQYGGGVEASGGNVVLNNTKIDQKGVYTNGWYSVALVGHSGGKITVNSGEYSGQAIETDSNASMGNCVAFTLSSGCTLDIYGGKFTAKVAEEKIADNFCGVIYADRAANVNIYGGTFISNGAILDMRNNPGTTPHPVATIYGGTFTADPSISGLYSSNLIKIAEGADIKIAIVGKEAIVNAMITGGEYAVASDLIVDELESFFGEYVKAGVTLDFNNYKLIRATGNGNGLYIQTTEKVVFNNANFETVKGGCVLRVNKDGANVEINNSVFRGLAAPSTGNQSVIVEKPNTTIVFNNCEFYNSPIELNNSSSQNVKVVFNNCKFSWEGANCPGFVKVGNITGVTVDLNNCEINYTAPKGDNFIDYNNPKEFTINFNNVKVNAQTQSGGILYLASSLSKPTINVSENCSYKLNGEDKDFNACLGY